MANILQTAFSNTLFLKNSFNLDEILLIFFRRSNWPHLVQIMAWCQKVSFWIIFSGIPEKVYESLFKENDCRDHSEYAPSQWVTALQCNAISHWLGVYIRMIPGTISKERLIRHRCNSSPPEKLVITRERYFQMYLGERKVFIMAIISLKFVQLTLIQHWFR